ncbi:MAG TPA: PQQ-binding-like beta-propeller repeat protein [Candidatus Udaeobacter sp.]|nr:PQQ-binding-like beta-propeller repeat protein [Candidatus Udaeobacter sp.]
MIFLSAMANAGSASQWPQYGFNSGHIMFNPFEHILDRSNVTELSLRWEFMTGNGTGIAPLSGPALADGAVYVASMAQTTFTALDADTGASRWIYTGLSTFSDPAVWKGHVYTASLDGNLYAFPTNCVGTCTPEWAVPIGTLGTNSPPTLSHGNIYVGGYDGRVYAFDATTGTQLWSGRVNPPRLTDPLNFAPAVSNDRVFVSGDRGIYAFPTDCTGSCAPLWIARTEFAPVAAPTIADGFVLVADYQGTVYGFDAATGSLNWTGMVAPGPHAIAVAHGVAYLSSGKGELVAFAGAGCGQTVCNPLWTSAPSGFALFTPTIANGVVYVGALDFIYTQGRVLAYSTTCADGCRPLATFVLGGANETPVAVAGGRIYATTVNGNIDSFGLPQELHHRGSARP